MAQSYWLSDPKLPDSPDDLYMKYLPHYPYLVGVPIRFVFKEKAKREEDDRPVVGKVSKISPVTQAMLHVENEADPVFLFQLGWDAWQESPVATREAWIDFLMAQCYCAEDDKDGSIKTKIRPPSISVFPEILNRHGTGWDEGIHKLSVIDLT